MKQSTIFFSIVIVLVLGGIFTVASQNRKGDAPGKYDTFAQCLKDKGTTFYGAFWCPHCKEQKALFGSSAKLLPYVECSKPDASGPIQYCLDKKIEGYPTWELADGTRLPVENAAGVSLKTLSEKTSCVLPE